MPKFLEDKLRAEDYAWAAGLFEGEGSVGLRQVTVTQKDTWVLHRLRVLFGGTVGNVRADGTSHWWICGQDGRDFIAAIYPWLSPRRQTQIDATFITNEKWVARRPSIRAKMAAINALRQRNLDGTFNCAKVS